jgi:hypothetical protein
MTGIPYAITKASKAQLAKAQGRDLESVPGEARAPVAGMTTQLDAYAVAEKRAKLKLGRAQQRYFTDDSLVQ